MRGFVVRADGANDACPASARLGGPRPEVLAVVLGREHQARLAAGLRARADVRFAARWREVMPILAQGRHAALIVELRDAAAGAPAAPTIAQVRRGFPYTPVLVLCPLTGDSRLPSCRADVSRRRSVDSHLRRPRRWSPPVPRVSPH